MSDGLENAFARIAVEHWRLVQILKRLVDRIPAESRDRVQAQIRFTANQLNTLLADQGYQLVIFDGKAFEPTLPIIPVNAEDFDDNARLSVSETIEPAILANGRIIQLGKVTLTKEVLDVPGH